MTSNAHAERLIAIAREAAAAILDEYRGTAAFELKQDGSPLTLADSRSHTILTARLEAFGLPVLSEEHPIPYATRRDWDEFWLVDPLDGTKDFLAHNDEFTINIARVREGVPVEGIVYAPALDELYYAERGRGAYQVLDARWVAIPEHGHCTERAMAFSRFHDVPAAAAFAEANGVTKHYRVGSALKFGRLARGDLSLYPRFTGSSEWDIAAGHCVVEAAGCRIVDLTTGAPPLYNKSDLLCNPFIVVAPTIDLSQLKF